MNEFDIPLPEESETQQVEQPTKKTKFFQTFALQHVPELRLLFRGGQLWSKEQWRNVVEHCVTEGVVAEELSTLLGLSPDEQKHLVTAALWHDWEKRLEKDEGMSSDDRLHAQQFLEQVHPDPILPQATTISFLEKAVVERSASELECLQFYIDEICDGSNMVSFDTRLQHLTATDEQAYQDEKYHAMFGMSYRERERLLVQEIESGIVTKLQQRGIIVPEHMDVPTFLRTRLEGKFQQSQ